MGMNDGITHKILGKKSSPVDNTPGHAKASLTFSGRVSPECLDHENQVRSFSCGRSAKMSSAAFLFFELEWKILSPLSSLMGCGTGIHRCGALYGEGDERWNSAFESSQASRKKVSIQWKNIRGRNLVNEFFVHFKVNSIRLPSLHFFSVAKIEFCANIYVFLGVGSAVRGKSSARVR